MQSYNLQNGLFDYWRNRGRHHTKLLHGNYILKAYRAKIYSNLHKY